jgi:hypothetical protein
MKKILAFLLFLFSSTFVFSQTIKTLQTEDGSKQVSIDSNNITTITFTIDEWSTMAPSITPTSNAKAICIDLNTKKSRCTKPLGFRCHVFSCEPTHRPATSTMQSAWCTLTSDGTNVQIVFVNSIDWDYLMNQ